MSLKGKSLVDLRGIAQALDVPDIFQKDEVQLRQAIDMKKQGMVSVPKAEVVQPAYDARLMTEAPGKIGDKAEIKEMLTTFVARGLHLSFSEEQWFMSRGKKTDEGTLRMPLRQILKCAIKVME